MNAYDQLRTHLGREEVEFFQKLSHHLDDRSFHERTLELIDRVGEEGIFDLDQTERGNIWLWNTDSPGDQNAWIRLGNDRWLQISTRLDNDPGLHVSVIRTTEEKLAAHVRREFGGGCWVARKMNLEGVEVGDNGNLLVDEAEWDVADETLPEGFDVADETSDELGDFYPDEN